MKKRILQSLLLGSAVICGGYIAVWWWAVNLCKEYIASIEPFQHERIEPIWDPFALSFTLYFPKITDETRNADTPSLPMQTLKRIAQADREGKATITFSPFTNIFRVRYSGRIPTESFNISGDFCAEFKGLSTTALKQNILSKEPRSFRDWNQLFKKTTIRVHALSFESADANEGVYRLASLDDLHVTTTRTHSDTIDTAITISGAQIAPEIFKHLELKPNDVSDATLSMITRSIEARGKTNFSLRLNTPNMSLNDITTMSPQNPTTFRIDNVQYSDNLTTISSTACVNIKALQNDTFQYGVNANISTRIAPQYVEFIKQLAPNIKQMLQETDGIDPMRVSRIAEHWGEMIDIIMPPAMCDVQNTFHIELGGQSKQWQPEDCQGKITCHRGDDLLAACEIAVDKTSGDQLLSLRIPDYEECLYSWTDQWMKLREILIKMKFPEQDLPIVHRRTVTRLCDFFAHVFTEEKPNTLVARVGLKNYRPFIGRLTGKEFQAEWAQLMGKVIPELMPAQSTP